MPKVILFTLTLWLSAHASAYSYTAYPNSGAFVSDLANKAVDLLGSEKTTVKQQEIRFRALLRDGFAVEKIGRFVLGKYRRNASEKEINEFLGLFEDYVVSLYSSAFRKFSGENFDVARVVKTRSPQDTMVITHVNSEDPAGPTKVIFQVRKFKAKYKILDVRIEGVSMIVTQRDEFTGFIQNNGGEIAPLLEALRNKTASLKTRARKSR